MDNIYLVGFMGSGKSATGKLLARKLGRRFMDTDAIIEARYGRPIAGIFAKRGEAGFRCLERRTVRSVSRRRGCIVSMGGGTVLENENWRNMRRSGISVFLSCSFQELWRRLRHTWRKRPLICGAGKSKVRALVDRRRAYYRKADITVSTTKKTPADVVLEIVERMQITRKRITRQAAGHPWNHQEAAVSPASEDLSGTGSPEPLRGLCWRRRA